MTNQTPSKAELHEIASTICDQLTRAKPGRGFGRLQAMIGATIHTDYSDNRPGVVITFKGSCLCATIHPNYSGNGPNLLAFKPGLRRNWCRISLNEDATHSIRFGSLPSATAGAPDSVRDMDGVTAEDLPWAFRRLNDWIDLHL